MLEWLKKILNWIFDDEEKPEQPTIPTPKIPSPGAGTGTATTTTRHPVEPQPRPGGQPVPITPLDGPWAQLFVNGTECPVQVGPAGSIPTKLLINGDSGVLKIDIPTLWLGDEDLLEDLLKNLRYETLKPGAMFLTVTAWPYTNPAIKFKDVELAGRGGYLHDHEDTPTHKAVYLANHTRETIILGVRIPWTRNKKSDVPYGLIRGHLTVHPPDGSSPTIWFEVWHSDMELPT